jgi:hypothetical protein
LHREFSGQCKDRPSKAGLFGMDDTLVADELQTVTDIRGSGSEFHVFSSGNNQSIPKEE